MFGRTLSKATLLLAATLAILARSTVVMAQTITWQEDWESPFAEDDWYSDNGWWEIGVPTYGPPTNSSSLRTHQGTKCAAVVLGGNYTDNRSSRLVCNWPISVPSADQNPRLRLWHWWNFHHDDFGEVQISTDNGATWEPLSDKYGFNGSYYWNYHSGLRWAQAWLDLAPYAGQTVKLGFYFYAGDHSSGDDTSAGWYIDDMVIETGPLAEVITPDDFEDSAAQDRWTADHGMWEIGEPTSGPGAAHSASNCLATLLDRNYYDNTWSRISSRPFTVPPEETFPRLRFWHWWSFSTSDYGKVQISTDDGTTWADLDTYQTSSPWTQPQLDLSTYAGQEVRLGFYIYAADPNTSSGWYIDDVRLVHDPALLVVDSSIVRAQEETTLTIAVAMPLASSGLSFIVDVPPGATGAPELALDSCWSGTVTAVSETQWMVSLQCSSSIMPAGIKNIGTISFTATSPHSEFVNLGVNGLVVTNFPRAYGYGNRVVVIADEPLLQVDSSGAQGLDFTCYGVPSTEYEIQSSPELIEPTWTSGATITTDGDMVYTWGGVSASSNTLYFRAVEK